MKHLALAFVLVVLALWLTVSAFADCTNPKNAIEAENCLAGTPDTQWDISGAGDSTIQGFATDISYNRGATVVFKINTNARAYKLDIYRMGYYGGNGARLITTILPNVSLPQTQPNCISDTSTGLLDCGNWAPSASWTIPANATSGIYFAKVTRTDTNGASHIVFIVRNDASTSDILFKTSDATWQAYNDYGGGNFYTGGPGPQGGDYKISYNRPFHTRVYEFYSWVFNAEYPMVRFLEANGYDVSYFTSLDTARFGSLIQNHKVFLAVGHDEYWSASERSNAEAARSAGVHLGFFTGNGIFWKTRWEPSIDGSNTANRTLVCYKETHANTPIDPLDPPTWTGTWRDARFSPPADGGRPENGLSGTIFMVNGPLNPPLEIKIPAADGKMRFWRNTTIASLGSNQTYTTNDALLGYEWDVDADNGARPAGLFDLSTASYNITGNYLLDNGSNYGNGTAVHHLTLYRYVNGTHSSLVFGAGTSQWPWALDANHDGGATTPDVNLQQATINLLADMGVQPVSLQTGLLAASASTDTVPPTSTISTPAAGASVQVGSAVTISGTATDSGGVVGGVEVSTDGGLTWHPATGRGSWTYQWIVPSAGTSATIMSRATDDSGNIETAPPSVTVSIAGGTVPAVTSVSPTNGAVGVSVGTPVIATFNHTMNASTITTSTFTLVDALNNIVPAAVSYNSTTLQATLTPSAALANGATYTARVVGGSGGVKDTSGTAMSADFVWSFTTATSGSCPCSIWSASTVPANLNPNDPNAVELGVRFTSDVGGYISGIRFYKGTANTGTHVGNLWSTTGALLATATFGSETASGWQQVLFANPVQIQPNTIYVASYHTNVGQYAFNSGYFASSAFNAPPLHAIQDLTSTGGNGVYLYGSGGFPNQTFQSTNYWVDVVFTTTPPPPPPPVVLSVSPAANAQGVAVTPLVTAQFSVAMTASSINTTTFQLLDPTGTPVASTVSYNSTNLTATLTPSSPLSFNTTYTAVVKGKNAEGAAGVLGADGTPMASNFSWSFTTLRDSSSYLGGPGGPILIITSTADPFSTYLPEILRSEGLNEFAVMDLSQVTSTVLSNYSLVVLGHTPLNSSQVTMFSTWVNGGGDLIAMRPDKQLASLLGVIDAAATLSDAYLLVNTTAGPGVGIVAQTIQYHSDADRYSLNGAVALATLYSNATTATSNPAVTLRGVGSSGGQAAAFTYDLARSVVYTRQGNPAWAGQHRDGQATMRSDDQYFGGTVPDYVDLNKVAIPQADEQTRLLANMILSMNRNPLPRFWYLPSGFKAAVVMTGDDHANGGTAGRFDQYIADSPAGCSVADWQCVRSTSYVFPGTPITNAQALSYVSQGFEVGLHPSVAGSASNSCADYTSFTQLDGIFATQLSQWQSQFPSLLAPVTNRTHCITWSDWISHPQVELNHNIRLDANYYYWPGTWINDRPGMFTGSGMPMRFVDTQGNVVDVYQATTQMTDESNQTYPDTVNALLDNALNLGYYGVFTVNAHTDNVASAVSDAVVSSAQARGVPIVSSLQMLTWLDGRNASSFGSIAWNSPTLSFTINQANGARNLQALLPLNSAAGALTSLTLNGVGVGFTTQTIKGIAYAQFAATSGTYQATYGGTAPSPTLASVGLSPSTVNGGSTTTGTVTLTGAAPSGGALVTLSSSNSTVAQVGANVTVSAGSTTATFPVTTSTVAATTTVTISGSFGTTQGTTLTVTPSATLVSVALSPTTVVGGNGSTGTVTLSTAAPAGGAVVTLSSSNSTVAQVAASVTVPAGATTATFPVTTTAVATSTAVTISGNYGATAGSTLTVTPATTLSALTLSPATVTGGTSSTGTVTLTAAAPTGGAVVALSSSNTNAATVPATVTVPAGATSATFAITTTPVAANTTAVISGTLGVTRTATLTINAPIASGVTKTPSSVVGGSSSTGTVTLSGAAPVGGIVVTLSSSNTSVAQVPASVTVAAGATTASFTITTSPVSSSTSVTISATLGVTRSTTLTVTPPSLLSLSLNPTTVTHGTSSVGTLTLNGPAPASGAVVSLTSANTSIAQVPSSATIPAGATTVTFTITTGPGTGNVRISGTYRGTTRSATLSVK